MRASRIPADWDDVTGLWMTAALRRDHPETVVDEVRVLLRDDGTNRRARLGLTYSEGQGPETVFVKAHDPAHRLVHLRNGNLFGEARLLASRVELPVDRPQVYKVIIDRLRLDFLLVMEDLSARGADPRDASRPLSVDQVANGLRGLARLHSRYWAFTARSQPRLRWVKTWKPTEGWQVGLRKRIPIGLERGVGSIPSEVAHLGGDEIVELWARYVSSLSRGAMTLLHGDAHIGNTYVLPDGDVGFLDWQVVRRGNWSQDVGYFVVGSLSVEDRRSSEAELLELYRQALEIPADQLPSAEAAWLRYRSTPAYGQAIWISTLGTDGWQRPELSLELARRFCTAFVKLDTTEALSALGC
jgi:hypothetical protein